MECLDTERYARKKSPADLFRIDESRSTINPYELLSYSWEVENNMCEWCFVFVSWSVWDICVSEHMCQKGHRNIFAF